MTATQWTGQRYAEALAFAVQFYNALDAHDADSVVSSFASGGIWHRAEGPKSGDAEIRGVVNGRSRDQTTSHIVANLTLSYDDGVWTSRYQLFVYGCAPDIPAKLFHVLDATDILDISDDGMRIVSKSTKSRLKFA